MTRLVETAPTAEGRDRPPRRARWLVGVILVALIVPGLVGFEFWPLTGWRLFSLSRNDTANRWVVEGAYADGTSRLVDLEELPVAYSNAEWPLRSVGGGSEARAEELCQVLLDAVVDTDPGVVELYIARDAQALVEVDGEWTVSHDLDVRHTCSERDG